MPRASYRHPSPLPEPAKRSNFIDDDAAHAHKSIY
jgi:hypothetical protein